MRAASESRSSNRSPSKRGRAASALCLAHAPGRWPEDPQPLPPFLCCYACTNRLPGSNHPAKAECAVLGLSKLAILFHMLAISAVSRCNATGHCEYLFHRRRCGYSVVIHLRTDRSATLLFNFKTRKFRRLFNERRLPSRRVNIATAVPTSPRRIRPVAPLFLVWPICARGVINRCAFCSSELQPRHTDK